MCKKLCLKFHPLFHFRSKSFIYFVKKTSTDDIDFIEHNKVFLTQDEVLALISDPGITLYADYSIVKADKPLKVAIADTSWMDTPSGIAVIALLCIAILLIVLLVIANVMMYCKKSSKIANQE